MIEDILSLLASLKASEVEGSFNVGTIPGNDTYFVGRNVNGEAVLLIKAIGTGRTVPIRLSGIEALFSLPCTVNRPGHPGFMETLTTIRCMSRDKSVEGYFCNMIGMLISVLGPAPQTSAVSGAVDQLIGLFQKLRAPARKSIVGLIGELLVINAARDTRVAVEAWRGDPDERYDFATGNLRLEAKATSTRNRIHQMSLEQASPPHGTVGLLASLFVEQSGGGTTMQSLLSSIESKLFSHESVLKFRMTVADTLGQDLLAAMGWSFDLQQSKASLQFFDLRTIPAIRGPLPAEVSAVRFSINLTRARRAGTKLLATIATESRGLLPVRTSRTSAHRSDPR